MKGDLGNTWNVLSQTRARVELQWGTKMRGHHIPTRAGVLLRVLLYREVGNAARRLPSATGCNFSREREVPATVSQTDLECRGIA